MCGRDGQPLCLPTMEQGLGELLLHAWSVECMARVHIPTGFRPEFRIPRNFRSFSPESIPMTF